jgi:hypothetical protein
MATNNPPQALGSIAESYFVEVGAYQEINFPSF